MKRILTLTTSVLSTVVLFTFSFLVCEIVVENLSIRPDLFTLYILLVFSGPALVLFVTLLFYVLFRGRDITTTLFSLISGLWLMFAIPLVFPNLDEYKLVFIPIFLLLITKFALKETNKWLEINGFAVGALVGFVGTYVSIIFFRYFTNSLTPYLTSYFYFNTLELIAFVAVTVICAVSWNIVKLRNRNQS